MFGWITEFRQLAPTVGTSGAASLVVARRRQWRGQRGTVRLPVPGAHRPLELRLGSSDLVTYEQVVLERTYAPLLELPDVRTILDFGANIGCTAVQLLAAHPAARLIAVEPDTESAALLTRNLEQFAGRADVLRGAVWTHETGLVLEERPYRDGGAWARQVRATRAGEAAAMRAWSVEQLIDRLAPEARIDIVKMDIEGAEALLLAHEADRWLDRIRCLAIELHDDSSFGPASPVFDAAMRRRPHRRVEIGDTTIVHFDHHAPPAP